MYCNAFLKGASLGLSASMGQNRYISVRSMCLRIGIVLKLIGFRHFHSLISRWPTPYPRYNSYSQKITVNELSRDTAIYTCCHFTCPECNDSIPVFDLQ